MIHSVGGQVTRNGNLVRSGIARAATIERYLLRQAHDRAQYHVVYWQDGTPHRVTADEFLTRYQAGMIPEARRIVQKGELYVLRSR